MEILKIDQISNLITNVGYVPMVKGSKLSKERDKILSKLFKQLEKKLGNQPEKL